MSFDASDVVKELEQLSQSINDDSVGTALQAGMAVIMNDAKRRVPKDTRTLARSLSVSEPMKDGNTITVKGGTNIIYARMIEYGGVIKPKRGKYLVWKNKQGETVLAKSVKRTAQPYMRPAWNSQRKKALEKVASVLKALLT